MQAYLIVIDMQNDFIGGALGTKEAVTIVPNVVARIQSAVQEGRSLIFTQDTHGQGYMQTNEGRHLPIPHCVKGTQGFALDPSVAPYAGVVVEKPSFGAPALITLLQKDAGESGANLDIELCGLCTDICVVTNALLLRAHFPEATLRVRANACAGVTPARHEAALEVLRACHVSVE